MLFFAFLWRTAAGLPLRLLAAAGLRVSRCAGKNFAESAARMGANMLRSDRTSFRFPRSLVFPRCHALSYPSARVPSLLALDCSLARGEPIGWLVGVSALRRIGWQAGSPTATKAHREQQEPLLDNIEQCTQ
jgi:hypothetical protein